MVQMSAYGDSISLVWKLAYAWYIAFTLSNILCYTLQN